jgi:RIO-like serine/threonine protein kinase
MCFGLGALQAACFRKFKCYLQYAGGTHIGGIKFPKLRAKKDFQLMNCIRGKGGRLGTEKERMI